MRCYLEDFNLLSSTCCKMEAARSVVFDRISYPALILAFCSSVHFIWPFTHIPMHMWCSSLLASTLDEYARCFSPSFPPFHSTWLSQPDAGAQELDATIDDDSYYTGGAYYYVQVADDDQE